MLTRCDWPPPSWEQHCSPRLPVLDAPSFNERTIADKPPDGRVEKVSRRMQQHLFIQRLRTLASLDEAVAGIVEELEVTGELDSTIILFTSDNGYLFGQHRLVGENVPYEEAIRVPLLMRGPGVPAGERRSQTVAMRDLAPTVAALAVRPRCVRSTETDLMPYVRQNRSQPDRALLLQVLQAGSRDRVRSRAWQYRAVRTDRYTLTRWQRPRSWELYDRRLDPWQLSNVYDARRYGGVRHVLRRYLVDTLMDCKGRGCRRPVPALPGVQH